MNASDAFMGELEVATTSHGDHRDHHGTLLLCYPTGETTVFIREIISFDAPSGIGTGRWLCHLADKHGVRLEANAEPFLVGPSVTGKPGFYQGMDQERMLRLYRVFGFTVGTRNGRTRITREANHDRLHCA